VFARMAPMFFKNPAILPFFFVHEMKLDEMQLATRTDLSEKLVGAVAAGDCSDWHIASHVSPKHLLDPLVEQGAEIMDANSNGAAAQMCREGQADACMTTTSARDLHRLTTAHIFGSPPMFFFGGITRRGLSVLEAA